MVILCRYRFSQRLSRYSHIFFLCYSLIWIMEYCGRSFNYWKLWKFRSRNAEVATRFFLYKKLLLKVSLNSKKKTYVGYSLLTKFCGTSPENYFWKWLFPTQIFELLYWGTCLYIWHQSLDNEILKSYLRPYKHL